ncbi:MAG: RidA family protein [Oceanospirillaceae bacterium]
MDIEKKLKNLGIILPQVNSPAGNYVSYQVINNMIYVSGQTTRIDGQVKFPGRLGKEFNIDDGKKAAKICVENILCQVKHACSGDLDRVTSIVKLNVFIQTTDSFTGHAQVADGASALLIDIFGEKGKHARTSTGANSLPSNTAVEIDAIFYLGDNYAA